MRAMEREDPKIHRMPHAQLTESIRSLVAATFARLRIAQGDELRESLLMRSGAYCGRRFEAVGGSAVWFAEENQIKFFAADGSVVQTIAATPHVPAQRLAA